jgi:hypothetical protein
MISGVAPQHQCESESVANGQREKRKISMTGRLYLQREAGGEGVKWRNAPALYKNA